jgi:hypothetical protein
MHLTPSSHALASTSTSITVLIVWISKQYRETRSAKLEAAFILVEVWSGIISIEEIP